MLRKSEKKTQDTDYSSALKIGASQLPDYLPDLRDLKVGLVVNHTSLLGERHLVDTLLSLGIQVKKVFAPEHGFRGNADAGEQVSNSTDIQTGLPIISLYGKNKKPEPTQIEDLDVLIFDIQDVGVRFYTYISTMHLVMEACAENKKHFIVLDRPNPNGAYVDGPIRKEAYTSFVGMHPIPIVHGLTVGELALMINGEGWLHNSLKCDLKVVKNRFYRHDIPYSLPVKPSPNLPNDLSIALYPSLCLFEGTQISVGRGTEFPFQVIGAPQPNLGNFKFIPESIVGMSKNPLYKGETCYGVDFRRRSVPRAFTLEYLIDFYKKYKNKPKFFNGYFDTLAGTDDLRRQIESGLNENQIRKTWEKPLMEYMEMRKKYLLYPDNSAQ
ncbi:MAG: DUF1343 domain-containing protein [Microscillaceae bacterium]|nr:DUF1343 domain-containing protein [Microscillaceae bacterium]